MARYSENARPYKVKYAITIECEALVIADNPESAEFIGADMLEQLEPDEHNVIARSLPQVISAEPAYNFEDAINYMDYVNDEN